MTQTFCLKTLNRHALKIVFCSFARPENVKNVVLKLAKKIVSKLPLSNAAFAVHP